MKRSVKNSRFVVPFACNIQPTTSFPKNEASEKRAKIQNSSTIKSTLSKNTPETPAVRKAEEILKFLSDSDEEIECQSAIQKVGPTHSKTPPVLSTNDSNDGTSCSGVKRKFSSIEECDDSSEENHQITSLSSEEILNMNSSAKEIIISSDAKYYSVIWCKRSAKKHKKWEGDAILIIKGRSAVLKDLNAKVIGSAIGYKAKEVSCLEDGSRFFIGGKECEIQGVIKEADYLSGQCFESQDNDCSELNICSKAKKFCSPLQAVSQPKQEIRKNTDSGVRDPDALYMPQPSAYHQMKHNITRLPVVDVKVDSFVARHLRPHQREGIIFMYECIMGFKQPLYQGVILGDQMGLGKTLQCISLIWTLYKQGPYGKKPVLNRVLIITPSSLVQNWEAEFFKWLGKTRIAIFAVGQKRKVSDFIKSNYTVLIISYEMYIRSATALSAVKFDLVICDEGHRLKNVNIKTSEVIMQVPTTRRILLTGTPIQNDLEEFYSIVEFVNPGILGSISSFRKVYQDPIVKSQSPNCSHEEKKLGVARAAELTDKIALFFLHRTQDVINQFLPPKYEIVVFCQPTEIQRNLYNHLLGSKDLQNCLLMDGSSRSGGGSVHLQFISALRKLCNHPSLLYRLPEQPATLADNNDEAEISDNSLLNHLYPAFPDDYSYCLKHSGKMRVLQALLCSIFAKPLKEKVVLVSNFTQMLDIIEDLCKEHKYEYLRLDGSTSTASRLELVERFNTPYTKFNVFLLSSKAGGVGLNLIGASRIILYDIDWNPATDLQAMSRVWRDGQKKPVYVYRLLTTGTLEEKMYQRQVTKQVLSGSVTDSALTCKTQFSYEELKDIFTFHEGVQCLTHDSIQCQCLEKEVLEAPEKDDKENSRPCQLGYIKAISEKKNTTMAELLRWKHVPSENICSLQMPNSFLEDCSDNVTFLFTNSTNVKSTTK